MESVGSLYRDLPTRDQDGGTVNNYGSSIAGPVPCSVQPARAHVISLYDQRDVEVDTQIYLTQFINAQPDMYFISIDIGSGVQSIFQIQGADRNLYTRILSPFYLACKKIS